MSTQQQMIACQNIVSVQQLIDAGEQPQYLTTQLRRLKNILTIMEDKTLWALTLVMKVTDAKYSDYINQQNNPSPQFPDKLRTQYKKHFEVWCSDAVIKANPSPDHAVSIIMNHVSPLTINPTDASPEDLKTAVVLLSNIYPRQVKHLRRVIYDSTNPHGHISEYLQVSICENMKHNPRYRTRDLRYDMICDYLLRDDADRMLVDMLLSCYKAIQRREPLPLAFSEYKQMYECGTISDECYKVLHKHTNPLQCISLVPGDPSECHLCFSEKQLYQFVECKHTGCYECLQRWHLTSKTCPMCRREYTNDSSESE